MATDRGHVLQSVNDGICKSLCSLSYVTVVEAAQAVVGMGKGALLAKVDVKSAYQNVPIHLHNRWLMGMLWEGSLYIDTALPFGLRSAPKIFTAVADAVVDSSARSQLHHPLS